MSDDKGKLSFHDESLALQRQRRCGVPHTQQVHTPQLSAALPEVGVCYYGISNVYGPET